MQPHLAAEAASRTTGSVTPPFRRRALLILWPAFLMAGVLEALVFVVVDPGQLHWFGGEALDWSRASIYSVTFFIIWGAIATSGALTALLESPG